MSRLSRVERTCTTIHGRLVGRAERRARRRSRELGYANEGEGESLPTKVRVSASLSLPAIGPDARNFLRYAYFRRTPKFRLESFDRLPARLFLLAIVFLSPRGRSSDRQRGMRSESDEYEQRKREDRGERAEYRGLAGKGGRRRRGKKERRTDTRGGRLSGRPIGWQVYKEGKARRGKERRGNARQRKTTQAKALQGRQQASKQAGEAHRSPG